MAISKYEPTPATPKVRKYENKEVTSLLTKETIMQHKQKEKRSEHELEMAKKRLA